MQLRFKLNKDKSDERFEFFEYPIENWMLTIIHSVEGKMYSVFAKKFIKDNWNKGYIELADHTSDNLKEAREKAKELYEVVLQYNPQLKWSEQ